MGIYFLDSSALVKRYVSETGSPWVIQQLDPVLQHDAFIAAIANELNAAAALEGLTIENPNDYP
jgi:predicted nucleic acid-binding protein